ncbi:PREDICTED: triggering receptor expressed on myeloid cells 1 isoform X1 [Hipposideros armiger]|uniref:Triggering receptor expressed on myeloid cells 1 isoform X1 n=1 Tax=Hipposideros armiger TaxID=186990 RepID=A0A8B7QQN6_HIPAR|nr:PREDICTED: triggering receptor expressed on myeloid cells 1 isoform X1 [Hipposideros armiger]XP_019490536.1 PREDICTED: triggering receptor expressed on myeloid cells 1 isoform X1 [Hipposideros armiger]XP_019490537.1 PREDICTED: triggering receptor expressed on myeloid cells 1 isoform X1 [Hipposideros armiger]
MERTVLRGWPWLLLLLLLWVSGFPAVGEEEDEICLLEGRNLTAVCTYNIMLYATSLKAWQRVGSQGPAETLVRTTTKYTDRNWARAGRYLLEDDPTNGGLVVTVTGLQRQDLGLYQCVIDLSPQKPKELFPRIRLVQCRDHSSTPASDKNPSRGLAQISTLPPLTFNTQSKLPTSPRTETPLLPMTTASLSSPGLEVNPTHKTDVIRHGSVCKSRSLRHNIKSRSLTFRDLTSVIQDSSAGWRWVSAPRALSCFVSPLCVVCLFASLYIGL